MEKRVDESWKEQVEREKSSQPPKAAPGPENPSPAAAAGPAGGPSPFGMFLSSLSMQAMMALGEMPHPMTQERLEDLEQARYLIDVLGVLQTKTRGNLTPEESQMLDGALYELRMKYVAKGTGAAR